MNKALTGRISPLSENSGKYYLSLFIIWPFVAFISALANYRQREARLVVYFFLIYYGMTFVNSNEAVDAFRYAMTLKNNAELPFSDFFKIVGGLYATDTSVDIVEPLISFIVSRLTSHYSLYFAIWAAIFGFFYLKSIKLLYNRYQENPGWNVAILLGFFVMILPITSISGVRMWTAAWIFFYGAYKVVLNRDPRFLILTLASTLVHWSFLSANIILIIYFFAGNRNLIYLPLTIGSFVLPQLIAPLLQSVSLRLGGGLQNRFENYSSEAYLLAVQESQEQVAWFIRLSSDLLFYYLIFAVLFIRIRFGSLMKEKAEKNLFSFLLLFLAFVNFGMSIPSFGVRFQVLFFLFATLYLFMFFIKRPGTNLSFVVLVGLFPMLLYAVINLRLGLESLSSWLFTPGFGMPYLMPVISVSDLFFR